jgi:hypothetical protein
MQVLFSLEQDLLGLPMLGVRNTTIYGTDSGTLRLFVKAFAFGTFVRYDKIDFVRHGNLRIVGMGDLTVGSVYQTPQPCPLRILPGNPTFVNGVVRTFWFAGTAIDALIGDDNGH